MPHHKKLKISFNMKIIKTLSYFIRRAKKNSLLLIYKALILSRIEYGSIIYNSTKTTTKQILNPIHNQAIRLAIEAFRTYRQHSMHRIARVYYGSIIYLPPKNSTKSRSTVAVTAVHS